MTQAPDGPTRHERIVRVDALNTHVPQGKALVVVPTYNERDNIDALIRTLAEIEPRVDVFVADDGSPDGTASCTAALAPDINRRVFVMRRAGKFGLGVAYTDAYRWILEHAPGYDFVLQMDADFSHDPHMLPLLMARAEAYGIAVGSRYVQGGATPDWDHRRFLLSHVGNIYARLVLRLFFPSYLIQDSTAGYVAFRRDVLARVMRYPILGDGYAYQTSIKLVAFRLGYPAIEVPIVFRDRRLGVSKLNRHIIFEAALMPWRLGWAFRKPLQPL